MPLIQSSTNSLLSGYVLWGMREGTEMIQTYQEQLRKTLIDLYYKGYHEGKGDIPNMDDVEITNCLAAINALNVETIKETEENWGNGLPLCNPTDLRQRFGVEL